jgi:DNA-binding MarR family transcriptional regulator
MVNSTIEVARKAPRKSGGVASGGETTDQELIPLVPGRIADHTSCLTLKVGQVIFRLMETRLATLGIRIRHYSVLETLMDTGPRSQQDLGTYLRIDGATMVATIDDLEALGWVARKRSAGDRRSYVISIMTEGKKKLRQINELIDDLDQEFLADINQRQHDQLRRIMSKLSEGESLIKGFDETRGR